MRVGYATVSSSSQIVNWRNSAITIIASHLPPLIPNRNAELLERSFTHKSWAIQEALKKGPDSAALKASVNSGCDKSLKLLGDGVLALYSVEVLGRRYP